MDAIQDKQHFEIWADILGSQIHTETLGAWSEDGLRSYVYSYNRSLKYTSQSWAQS